MSAPRCRGPSVAATGALLALAKQRRRQGAEHSGARRWVVNHDRVYCALLADAAGDAFVQIDLALAAA